MFYYLKQKGINAVYTTVSIEGFAYSLIGIFIPIYLLKLGYSLSAVFIFFIVHNLSLAIFSIIAGYTVSRIGYIKPMLFRFPLLFLFLFMLYNLKALPIPLYVLAALNGAQVAFYWIPLNILFAKNTRKEKIGSAIGKLFALPQLAALIGPFLGGLIAVSFGFKFLFAGTFLLLLISLVPLITARGLKSDFKFELKKGVAFFIKNPKYIITEIFDNIGGEMEGVIWPIFIYLNFLNIVAVGIVGTLIALGTTMFTLMIGNYTDKFSKRLFIRIGAVTVLSVWILRLISDSETIYLVSAVLAGFAMSLLLVPYTSLIFSQAKKQMTEEFFVVKELPTVIGRIAIFSIALLLVENLKFLFPIAGVAYLSFFLL
ncbi:MAG: MFS transporter [Planctomycetes bacterium]|jgi:DHA1 family multidrug resistance protein-like MFS transporter|nr:MFS transporter [Planctomycetota bacterium]